MAFFFFAMISFSKALACSQGCGNQATTTATSTCACADKRDCDCTQNGKDCKCGNCIKSGTSTATSTCGCNDNKDCKCAQNGKDCKCGNCNKNKIENGTREARGAKNNASQTGRLARIKGWLKGLAFWKRK